MHIAMSGLTHPGRVRGENEDCIVTRSELGLAVLADGMGGHQAGEVASRMAVDLITQHLAQPSMVAARKALDRSPDIAEAIHKANAAIYEAAQARPDYKGMGSTVVVVIFSGDKLCVGHVGDSRLYRLRAGAIEQITKDHSVVQELVNRGLFTPEEARQSLAKNLVTRALGVDPTIEAETAAANVQPEDLYLLCSDGLTDVVSDEQITEILRRDGRDLNAAARLLIERANEQGGPDNISVILVRASDSSGNA
jgi:serine/threonine protein phosphatase PrpC